MVRDVFAKFNDPTEVILARNNHRAFDKIQDGGQLEEFCCL